jgi:predicted component of type VI protein secretion system
MCRAHGSTCRNALCSDLEPGAQHGGAADRQAGGVATRVPQPQPQPHTHNSIHTNLSSIVRPHHLIGSPSNSAIISSKTGTIDPQRIRAQPHLDPPQSHQNRLRSSQDSSGARGLFGPKQTKPLMGLSAPKSPLPCRRTPNVAHHVARPRS